MRLLRKRSQQQPQQQGRSIGAAPVSGDVRNPLLEIPPALTLIENLNLPASPTPRRQDFVQLRRKPSVSSVYSLGLFCKVQAYDEWVSSVSNKLVYRWRTARIIDVDENGEMGEVEVLIAFDGFSSRWDVWIDLSSGKVRCPLAGPVSYKQRTFQPKITPDEDIQVTFASPNQPAPRLYRSVSTTSSLNVEFEDEGSGGEEEPIVCSSTRQESPSRIIGGPFFSSKPPDLALIVVPSKTTRGVSGLQNLGNTCFMNSILQSLSFTPPFAIALLSQHPAWKKTDLVQELCQLLREQWAVEPVHPRNPSKLREMLQGSLPHLFAGNRQQDAQEFFCLLLDLLHETNNKIKRKPTYSCLQDFGEDQISSQAWSMYERGSDSFIKDLFCGQFMSRKRCLHCGEQTFSCDVFFDLQVPLFTLDTLATGLRLEDLLGTYFKTEQLVDMSCAQCKVKGGITRQLTIERFPTILVIMFKRSLSLNKKVQTPVSFPLKGLKIRSSGSKVYDLVSVVNHHGTQSIAGHYTSDMLHPLSGNWYHASDAKFTQHQHRNSVGKDAFMLFYADNEQLVSSEFLQSVYK
ncbi:hypothetical protein BASA81_006398 [Batrachochytrium salamandrivorans]|nr:hypothetical protein BASA81_006398 [Batrachochytrium salamandrivorans]